MARDMASVNHLLAAIGGNIAWLENLMAWIRVYRTELDMFAGLGPDGKQPVFDQYYDAVFHDWYRMLNMIDPAVDMTDANLDDVWMSLLDAPPPAGGGDGTTAEEADRRRDLQAAVAAFDALGYRFERIQSDLLFGPFYVPDYYFS